MTNSTRTGKRERLAGAAVRVLHEQGVEKTTLADIARAADVPVGNVYYYFKTKDQLIEAAIEEHGHHLDQMIQAMEGLATPQERLKALIQGWIGESDLTARYGCPTGTLAAELDKRDDGLDRAIAGVMGRLLDWVQGQFAAMGRPDARELAVALFAAYQGAALLTNTFRDPGLMRTEGHRLERWIDSLA
ncbi:TetR family transcriptional regulator [[Actinomadura] parvosata subsp. kistnae]|uniref:TetR family transcriptional regulator n=1 Tax=[Actinomadura] parvosata subsp. kistnae TaxID=1909395 RepID=A0A1V0A0W9_9ACTN|nr:TetR/AcrR family transcriptional regulator [Nonomuraea sp. ATCC 55076]AQZ63855.1 TetR family transcriptional regulator [Nonomuraea sp. ATCC 55076]